MFNFESIYNRGGISADKFFICIGTAFLLGLLIAIAYRIKNKTTKSMLMTLVLLPMVVQIVVMMIDGDNIGGGIAVAGAFSLVRFRSAPGNALDIAVVFLAMAVGLTVSVGYITLAFVFTLIVCAILIALRFVPVYEASANERFIKITMPDDLDFEKEFPDIFARHTKKAKLLKLRTKSMGTLYVAYYVVTLINSSHEKALLDELRVVNSNLPISCGYKADNEVMEEL